MEGGGAYSRGGGWLEVLRYLRLVFRHVHLSRCVDQCVPVIETSEAKMPLTRVSILKRPSLMTDQAKAAAPPPIEETMVATAVL